MFMETFLFNHEWQEILLSTEPVDAKDDYEYSAISVFDDNLPNVCDGSTLCFHVHKLRQYCLVFRSRGFQLD